jgi:hypothetical protein
LYARYKNFDLCEVNHAASGPPDAGLHAAPRAIVAAWPDIPSGTPEFHVSMNFNHSEGDYGGSDVYEKVTEDVGAYLAALHSEPTAMMVPFL